MEEQGTIRKRRKRNIGLRWAILAVLLLALMGVGGVACYKLGYKNGQVASQDEAIRALGKAVSDKNAAIALLEDLNSKAPTEVDTENLKEYLANLDTTIGKIENPEAKDALEKYRKSWQELEQIYDRKDEQAMGQALQQLEVVAKEVAGQFTAAYNEQITEAANQLSD